MSVLCAVLESDDGADADSESQVKSVEQKLMEDGNFEEYYVNGIPRKRLTDKGREFGIEAEKRLSEKGNEYEVFYYTEEAQRGIVELLLTAENGGK